MPIKLNHIDFDFQQFRYSLIGADGNTYLDHVTLPITTENTLADLRATAQADAQAKKAALKADLQARDAVITAQIAALTGAGLP